MLVPFGGRGTAHAGRRYRMRPARCRIGLLEFGRDRWAALTAGQDGGEFVTEPAEVTGDRLSLNVAAACGCVSRRRGPACTATGSTSRGLPNGADALT